MRNSGDSLYQNSQNQNCFTWEEGTLQHVMGMRRPSHSHLSSSGSLSLVLPVVIVAVCVFPIAAWDLRKSKESTMFGISMSFCSVPRSYVTLNVSEMVLFDTPDDELTITVTSRHCDLLTEFHIANKTVSFGEKMWTYNNWMATEGRWYDLSHMVSEGELTVTMTGSHEHRLNVRLDTWDCAEVEEFVFDFGESADLKVDAKYWEKCLTEKTKYPKLNPIYMVYIMIGFLVIIGVGFCFYVRGEIRKENDLEGGTGLPLEERTAGRRKRHMDNERGWRD